MSWPLQNFWSGQQQQPPANIYQDGSANPYTPHSMAPSSSRPSNPESASSSSMTTSQKPPEYSLSTSHGSASPDAARITAHLKDLSVDELRKLLSDKDAYTAFFNSLDQVKEQNTLRDDLRNATLQLARDNLDKEQRILELRNQCTIICTTELAVAQDRLDGYLRRRDEILKLYSLGSLLGRLQESMVKSDKESEVLYHKLLMKEIDLPTFVNEHKKLRMDRHKKALLHLAARTSLV